MGDILVVAEHRDGALRDISHEMLFKAGQLSREHGHTLSAVVLGGGGEGFLEDLRKQADQVISLRGDKLKDFDAELHGAALRGLMEEMHPLLTVIGHTSRGMDLAPTLAVRTGFPLVTDCVDLTLEDGRPRAVRQMFGGKVLSKVSFRESAGYLVTVRPGAFPPADAPPFEGKLVEKEAPKDLPDARKRFVEFVDAAAGELDITQAELLISIGRGIGEEENVAVVKELADGMGGMLSCSRPVVDKKWLPAFHQVGTSGKSVKPKVYLAFGISGASQHVAGITGAGTVIAVNKDPKAPIFRVADYGIVADMLKIVQALKEKLKG